MNPEFKQYLAELGKRGGSATSEKKGFAVRVNGALGGRPRKDGMPPGSRPLWEVAEWIEASAITEQAKLELNVWARWKADVFKDGEPWVKREAVERVKSTIGCGKSSPQR